MSDTPTAEASQFDEPQPGIPVDAICTGCAGKYPSSRIKVKRAPPEQLKDDGTGSFKHACHRCGTVEWWNAIEVLSGLMRSEP